MTFQLPYYDFPERYNDNYLVLMVRDPRCVFAYWEFSDEQMDLIAGEFRCPWGEVPLLLRVYDLTGLNFDGGNAHSHFDIPVHPLANNHYINNISANHSYCADLGLLTDDGRFVTLCRSDVIQTPRESTADGAEVVWADLLDRSAERKSDNVIEMTSFSSEGVYINYGENPGPEAE